MPHRYKLKQLVRINSEAPTKVLSPNGVYDIIQLMPQSQDGSFTYRLRSSAGDRIATESVIIPVRGEIG